MMKGQVTRMNDFIRITDRKTGETFYYKKSDFCGECWHIYVSAYHYAWIYNIFDEKEFNERFEPFNEAKCKAYIEKIRNGR